MIATGLLFTLVSCEQECGQVAQPALYFTLVDPLGKPLLSETNTSRLTVTYKRIYSGQSDTLRGVGFVGTSNHKYPSVPLLASQELLAQSPYADSASYQFLLDKKPVGTLRLYPFQKATDCDRWIYTSAVTFNGKVIPPVGPTNEVYLLPVIF